MQDEKSGASGGERQSRVSPREILHPPPSPR
jgi:hypothetical protein